MAEASARVGADTEAVMATLTQEAARPDAEPAWGDTFELMPLVDVVEHLATVVHPKARRDVLTLRALCPSGGALAKELKRLCDELEAHLTFEEQHLFPYVVSMEESGEVPPALFDSVIDPCRMLLREHEIADHTLDAIRAMTDDYRPPDDADDATRALYTALANYDRELVLHMHIESNILFPRAQQLEAKTRVALGASRAWR